MVYDFPTNFASPPYAVETEALKKQECVKIEKSEGLERVVEEKVPLPTDSFGPLGIGC